MDDIRIIMDERWLTGTLGLFYFMLEEHGSNMLSTWRIGLLYTTIDPCFHGKIIDKANHRIVSKLTCNIYM